MQPLDIAALAIIAAASLRGVFIGLVREGFSLAAIAGAYLAVQQFTAPAAQWLEESSEIRPAIAPWIAGALVALGTLFAVVLVGRLLRRALHSAGLSGADRAAGALLGATEGALVAGILLVLGTEVLGRDHPVFAETVSLAALERFEQSADTPELHIDVATPPRTF